MSEIPEPVWRPVPGYEFDYEVNEQGDVRSLPRQGAKGGLRRPTLAKVGYLKLELWSRGRGESRYVHEIVAAAFLGPRPIGLEIRHLDGNPLNCALSNLAYGTHGENVRDKRRHGTDHNVNKTHCPQGHPYDEANTIRLSGGRRDCRTCTNARARRRYWRRKAEWVAAREADNRRAREAK
ncbi:NUMOD4 motif-containing HNH endonuclease [Streptomyces sp. NPDC053086]|uniref:NUMOD4 motif-containing HNH endonuclease n=1 Tax=unclassified Streptomyces TaxID=2593676 RepID=UPI0037D0AE0B